MCGEKLHYLAKCDLLRVEWVQYLQEVCDVILGKRRHFLPFKKWDDFPLKHADELLLRENTIIVCICSAEQARESLQIGLMLAQLEVLQCAQEVREVHFPLSQVVRRLKLHLLFSCQTFQVALCICEKCLQRHLICARWLSPCRIQRCSALRAHLSCLPDFNLELLAVFSLVHPLDDLAPHAFLHGHDPLHEFIHEFLDLCLALKRVPLPDALLQQP
jgi:hypothetical protein